MTSASSSLRPSTVRWRILALLVVASFVSYVLRYNISTAGPTLVSEFGLSEQQFGWVLAAFTLGYTLFQFPSGVIIVRYGARKVLTGAMILWGLLTLVTGLVPAGAGGHIMLTIFLLILIRFVVGICHAPIYPATGGVVEKWFSPTGRALPNGLSSAGLTLGIAATAPMLAWMMNEFGWRSSFMMFAPMAFVSAALWWWYTRDEPQHHWAVNKGELQIIGRDTTEASSHNRSWWRVLRNRNVLLLTVSYFCANYLFYQMFNWVFYYLVDIREIDSGQASLMTSSLWIMGAVGAVAGGLLCDWWSRQSGLKLGCRMPAVVSLFLATSLMLVGAFSHHPSLAVIALAACFLFHQMCEGPYWAAAISVGGEQAAAASGVMNTGGNAVGFVNALLVPFISSVFGWTVALASAAVFAGVAASLWFFIDAEKITGE